MHASIEHLLSLRDGEPVAADIAEHVAQCAACSAHLRQLSIRREQLRALPQLDADPAAWSRIQSQLSRPSVTSWRRRAGLIAASAACVTLAIVAAVALRSGGERRGHEVAQTQDMEDAQSDSPDLPHVAELIVQSQRLDGLLQRLPERPRIERVSTAATIDSIEERIQWLDLQLSFAPDEGLSAEQARQLWRERVELMNSLVKVRYAEAGRSSF